MAQTSVNFRMDAELKESVEEICRKMGMNLTTAITIFCTKVAQERRIPFEITADPDPFYSESNIRYLEKIKEDSPPCFIGNIYLRDGRIRLIPVDTWRCSD